MTNFSFHSNLSFLVEQIQDGVALFNANRHLVWFNPALLNILGLEASWLQTNPHLFQILSELIKRGTWNPAQGLECRQAVAQADQVTTTFQVTGANGHGLTARVTTTPAGELLLLFQHQPYQTGHCCDRQSLATQAPVQDQAPLQRLNYHIENLPLAVIEWNQARQITCWSREAETIFGWTAAEVLGQPLGPHWKFFCDEMPAGDTILPLLQPGKSTRHTWPSRNYRKDGSVIDCEWYSSVLTDAAGQVVSVLSLVVDVTERKQTEAELERQSLRARLFADITLKIRQSLHLEQILQTTVDEVRQLLQVDRVLLYRLLPDGTGRVETEAIVNGCNSLLGQVFSPEVFPGEYHGLYREGRIRSVEDIETAPLSPCHIEFLRQLNVKAKLVVPLLLGQNLWGLMIAHQCGRSRTWSSFEVELLQQLADQAGIALAQAQLLKALSNSEERFRQLTESIDEVFWLRDPVQQQIIYISPAYEEIWGHSCESMYKDGLSWLSAVHPEDRPRIEHLLPSQLHSKYEAEYRILRPDGSLCWIRDRSVPVFDRAGVICRIAGIAEDITERKRLEEELLKTLKKEKELSELKSRFVTMTSHEFRTPLSTILSAAELLEYYGHLWSESERQEQLHLIQDTVQHMTQLLEDVLLIGRAEANRIDFYPSPLNLVHFCQELVAQIQLSIGKNHTLTFVHEFPTGEVWVDEKLLRQILSNLLSNAIKYSPAASLIKLSLNYQVNNAVFQVSDQGIGIPPQDLPHLFESFHRAENVGAIPGTGLGLAIVKRCIEVHRGTVTVESQMNSGTTFTVSLPIVKDEN
mgnify:CR=1 FL=1